MTPALSTGAEAARRRLALCLDVAATIGLIAGMAALLAVADIRTFGVSRTYLAAIVVTAPIAGLIYVAGRRISADPACASRFEAPTPPETDRELRRRLLKCLADLLVFLCVLNMILLPGNLVLAANRWLDRSQPVDAVFVVGDKRRLHKDKRAFFAMPGAGDAAKDSVPVSSALYDRIVLNRTKVIVPLHDGALGFPWTKHDDFRWSDLAPPR